MTTASSKSRCLRRQDWPSNRQWSWHKRWRSQSRTQWSSNHQHHSQRYKNWQKESHRARNCVIVVLEWDTHLTSVNSRMRRVISAAKWGTSNELVVENRKHCEWSGKSVNTTRPQNTRKWMRSTICMLSKHLLQESQLWYRLSLRLDLWRWSWILGQMCPWSWKKLTFNCLSTYPSRSQKPH